jgi:hypothetical protein
VHSKLYDRHRGKLLPADEFLRNIIEQDFKIPKDLLETWTSYFKDAAEAAGVLFQRPDGKYQLTEDAVFSGPAQNPQLETDKQAQESSFVASTVEERMRRSDDELPTGGHTTKIALSGKRYAVFSFPDSLTAKDAQKLKGALSGLSAIIDSMVDDIADLL